MTTLFIDADGGGGVNTYLEAKARDLGERPHVRHTIIVPGQRDERVDDWLGTGAALYKVASKRLPWNPDHRVLFRSSQIERILKSTSPDVVEVDCAYWFSRTVARVLGGRDVPILGIYHVHLPAIARSGLRHGWRRPVGSVLAAGAWRYTRYCMAACEEILVTSSESFAWLEARGVQGLRLLPLAVDTTVFAPAADAGSSPRRPRPEIERRLLYVGRLSAEKELQVLLDAFDLLPAGFTLDIVGEGPLRKALTKACRSVGRIRFLGPCAHGPELAAHYRAADVFVMPGSHETFGLTALEAAACGTPVVAADAGGLVDTVTADLGIRVTPGSPKAFADGILQMLRDREEGRYVSADAAAAVHARHSWSRCFDELVEVYARAVRARRGSLEADLARGGSARRDDTVPLQS